jgi:RND family efflux transporter MFP subunit
MKRIHILTLLSAWSALGGLTSCEDSSGKEATMETTKTAPATTNTDLVRLTPTQLKTVNVDMVTFEERALKPIIHANGVIKLLPDSKAEVSSHIEGKIDQIYVREGQSVRKGQPIVRLSSFQLLELQNDYAAAHADVEFLEAEYKRQDELRKSNIGVLAQYQSADSKLKAARAREMALKDKLQMIGIGTANIIHQRQVSLTSGLVIRAPIDGYVSKFYENIGSLVQPQTLLAEIINPNRIEANVFVYEKDADYIREGQPIELRFVNRSIAPVHGKVVYIARSVNDENRAITLHVNFNRPKNELIAADMNVQARIIGAGEHISHQTLPRTALLDDGDGKFIFVTNQPNSDTITFRKQKVEVTSQGDQYIEVKPVGKLPANVKVANNNVLALEAERKKNE